MFAYALCVCFACVSLLLCLKIFSAMSMFSSHRFVRSGTGHVFLYDLCMRLCWLLYDFCDCCDSHYIDLYDFVCSSDDCAYNVRMCLGCYDLMNFSMIVNT